MCGSTGSRLRRLAADELTLSVDIVFELLTGMNMETLLSTLNSPAGVERFKQGANLADSVTVSMTAFSYSQNSSDSNPSTSTGGTVNALIDLSLGGSSKYRRLREASMEDMRTAIVTALTELVPLPAQAVTTCTVSAGQTAADLVANVSISVQTDVTSVQSSVTTFLVTDSAGPHQLPSLISMNSGASVSYTPGYVPIVWTTPLDGSPLMVALNVLPFVLGGIALIVLVASTVGYKYRFVIRSWWEDIRWTRFGFGGDSAGWTNGQYAAHFMNRGKSDVSSTPDTATNVDDNEIDDIMMRYLGGDPGENRQDQ